MIKQIISILFLLTVIWVAPVFAQEEEKSKKIQISEEQYKAFCKSNFVGDPISLNVVNADIRDILNYITDQYGYDFALDDSIGRVVSSVNFDNVPWNIVLNEILESKDLGIQCKGRFFLITTLEKIRTEGRCLFPESKPAASAVYTEFIKLKKLPPCANKATCEQTSQALNHLKASVARRISNKGQIEIDERSQVLIITDVRDNLDTLKILVESLDNEEFYKEAEKGK